MWSRASDEVTVSELPHFRVEEERFLASPFVPIFAGRGGIRRRLIGPDAKLDFPVLRDLAEEGATDYVAMPITFSDGQIHALTLATDAPGGFRTEDLGHLHEILPLVSRFVEVHSMRHRARTLLDTYLGTYTGEGHETSAARMVRDLPRVDPALSTSWVHSTERGSSVFWGRYAGPDDAAAQRDLQHVRGLAAAGRPVFPRALLSRVRLNVGSQSQYALLSVRDRYPKVDPLYTLQVAVWGVFESDLRYADIAARALNSASVSP